MTGKTDEQAEADRAWFAAKSGGSGGDVDPAPEQSVLGDALQRAAGRGRAVEDEEDEEPKAPEAAADDEAPDTDQDPQSGVAERDRAWLRLKGVPDTTLGKLDPQELAAMRASLKATLAEGERAIAERGRMRKELDDLRSSGSERAREGGRAAESTERVAPPAVFDDLKAKLADDLGESTANAVTEYMRVLQAQNEEAKRELAQLRDEVRSGRVAQVQDLVTSVRTSLLKQFPALADDEVFEAVAVDADALGRSPRYANGLTGEERIRTLLTKAARASGLRERAGSAGEDSDATAQKRQASPRAVTTETRRKPPAVLSPQDADRAIYEHLRKHPGDTAGAARIAAKVNGPVQHLRMR